MYKSKIFRDILKTSIALESFLRSLAFMIIIHSLTPFISWATHCWSHTIVCCRENIIFDVHLHRDNET